MERKLCKVWYLRREEEKRGNKSSNDGIYSNIIVADLGAQCWCMSC